MDYDTSWRDLFGSCVREEEGSVHIRFVVVVLLPFNLFLICCRVIFFLFCVIYAVG